MIDSCDVRRCNARNDERKCLCAHGQHASHAVQSSWMYMLVPSAAGLLAVCATTNVCDTSAVCKLSQYCRQSKPIRKCCTAYVACF